MEEGQAPVLGARMHSCGIVLHGQLPELRWLELLEDIAKAIGMSAVSKPKVWTYPFEGKGGTGQTILLPITESFLALDTWSDHSGAYLFVCSCRPYERWKIETVIGCYGLRCSREQDQHFYAELNLK